MRVIKKERVEEILHRVSAEWVRREATPASLITITRIELSPAGKEAKIFFTTLPESQEETAEKFLMRKLPEFKKYLREKSKIGFIPHLNFKIDKGERNRQRLDVVSASLK